MTSDTTLVLREAVEEDLDAIVGIERKSFGDPWSRASFRSSLGGERMRFLVAEEVREGVGGGRCVVGYVIALMLFDEAEIANIAVAEDARRRGVGGLLLDHAIEEAAARGTAQVYLEVRESNAGARALYESRSFAPVGRRRGYYRNPTEDALLLRRELAP
ncbi:MAG: ribosomal protein S18-alanine N-acetyltransferase [Gemmatimonadaceae bacterium]